MSELETTGLDSHISQGLARSVGTKNKLDRQDDSMVKFSYPVAFTCEAFISNYQNKTSNLESTLLFKTGQEFEYGLDRKARSILCININLKCFNQMPINNSQSEYAKT